MLPHYHLFDNKQTSNPFMLPHYHLFDNKHPNLSVSISIDESNGPFGSAFESSPDSPAVAVALASAIHPVARAFELRSACKSGSFA